MSFTPLPTIFTDLSGSHSGSLRGSPDSDNSRNLELGCGDGRFQAEAARCGVKLWGLDLSPPAMGTTADIVGDACFPPITPGSLDLLVAPNLVRHLLAVSGGLEFLDLWLTLLKPGGSLFIFEDEPTNDTAATVNYRDLQDFLRQLVPESRGGLLPLAEFLELSAQAQPGLNWEHGLARNLQPIDSSPVLALLGPGPLKQSIVGEGLDPGRYWWAQASAGRKG